MNFLYSALNIEKAKARGPDNKVTKYIYRDELSKKKPKPSTGKLKGEMEAPLLQRQEYNCEKILDKKDEHQGLRVKILMTKEEATRLLSKCKNGGVLEFNDMAHELARIPMNRVRLGDGVLKSIPEEF